MKIALFGADGRMGKRVSEIAKLRGHQVWEIERDTEISTIGQADVAVDFSLPEATERVCKFCLERRCPLVSGVTGRAAQESLLDELEKSVKVVRRANFSKGIAATIQVCKLLAELNWDCEIVETHRKDKKDSPSGTAREIAVAISQHGTRRVQIHALRCGSFVGNHKIVFATDGESITVTHQAQSLDIFALGAVQAAEELVGKKT